jgi:WD40 repeat protein
LERANLPYETEQTMHPRRLSALCRRLHSRLPVLGAWLRRRAAHALAVSGSAEAAEALARELARDGQDPAWRDLLRLELARLDRPECRDAVCAVWADTGNASLAALVRAFAHVPEAPPRLRVRTALHLQFRGILDGAGAEEVVALAEAGGDPAEEELAARARDWLARLDDPAALEVLATRWADTRDPRLLPPVARTGHLPRPPRARLLLALKLGRLDVASRTGAGEVKDLLAARADADPAIASSARAALGQLADPDAREALCQLALDDPLARDAALAAGYLPRRPERQALFLLLTGQWDRYDALDFERRLLRAAYQSAAPDLRKRLADRARSAGRADLIASLAAGPGAGPLSPDEWQLTLDSLDSASAWPQLWDLARAAPPRWAARILRRLAEKAPGWRPPGETGYEELRDLAKGWGEDAFGPDQPCRARLAAHAGPVECLAASPDGTLLASAGQDGTVKLWRLPAGEPLGELPGAWRGPVHCLLFSPGGGALLAGGAHTARLWGRSDAGEDRTFSGCTGMVQALALTTDGKTLVTLSEDFAQVWDLTEKEPEGKPLEHGGGLTCLAISPDNEVLATGTRAGTVWLSWHLPHGELKDELVGHSAGVTQVAFSADGKLLASADSGGEVRLWDVGGLKTVRTLSRRSIPLGSPDFLPDPRALVGRRRPRVALLWPLPDGRVLAARVVGRAVALWTPGDGHSHARLAGHERGITCLAGSPAGKVAASGSVDGSIRLWGLPSPGARLGARPAARMRLTDWEWVRARLAEGGLPEAQRRALLFLDAFLRLRWGTEVHLEDAKARPAGHDIALEG